MTKCSTISVDRLQKESWWAIFQKMTLPNWKDTKCREVGSLNGSHFRITCVNGKHLIVLIAGFAYDLCNTGLNGPAGLLPQTHIHSSPFQPCPTYYAPPNIGILIRCCPLYQTFTGPPGCSLQVGHLCLRRWHLCCQEQWEDMLGTRKSSVTSTRKVGKQLFRAYFRWLLIVGGKWLGQRAVSLICM